MKVEFYETQLSLLDKLVEADEFGRRREEVLRRVLLEHVGQRLEGRGVQTGGPPLPDTVEVEFPEYGRKRLDVTLQPVTGKAVPVYRGEVLRIEQTEGGQCVDLNAYNLYDYKEYLSCGFTRSAQGFNPRKGEVIWTNAPRGRPMFAILEMAETCVLDIAGHRCNRVYFELRWNDPVHMNCQDTFAEAIREYGLTPDDVHDSFNLWMVTTLDAEGRKLVNWNPARKGDRVDLLAGFDVLAVAIICGSSDLTGMSNFTLAPVQVQVFEPSESSVELANLVEERWSKLKGQKTVDDFRVKELRTTRELKPIPGYRPDFMPVPKTHTLDVQLTSEEATLLSALMRTGTYGQTEGEVLRAAFMRWWNSNRLLARRPKLLFRSA